MLPQIHGLVALLKDSGAHAVAVESTPNLCELYRACSQLGEELGHLTDRGAAESLHKIQSMEHIGVSIIKMFYMY